MGGKGAGCVFRVALRADGIKRGPNKRGRMELSDIILSIPFAWAHGKQAEKSNGVQGDLQKSRARLCDVLILLPVVCSAVS